MQTALGTLEHYKNVEGRRLSNIASAMVNWLCEIFGCPHKQMSRPFSRHGEAYRVCLACGARRRFDEQTWNTRGPFYYKPARTSDLTETNVRALGLVRVR
jgi:hypothetical protein